MEVTGWRIQGGGYRVEVTGWRYRGEVTGRMIMGGVFIGIMIKVGGIG